MKIEDFIDNRKEVFLIRNVGNRGDGLIEQGTIKFFEDLGVEIKLLEYFDTETTGDLLFVAGCGAFCHQWNHMIGIVEKQYTNFDRIVILPSTFDLTCPIVNEWASNIPEHVTIFCRDGESYRQLLTKTKKVYLGMDMAFYFDYAPFKKNGSGILLNFRDDSESTGLIPLIQEFDNREDIPASGNIDGWEYLLDTVSKYSVVHTDRLHVSIAATMLDKKVYLYPNKYHKNKEVFNHTLKNYNNIKFCEFPDKNTVSIICAVMNREHMLKISLNSWLKFEEVGEIVIVDWSSDEDISWVLKLDSRIKLIKVKNEKYFNISQAYNLAFDHTTKDIILKLDVDYILNPYHNFFHVNPLIDNIFYTGNTLSVEYNQILSYLNGLCYIKREDFLRSEGYNENFSGYGYDDDEFRDTVIINGSQQCDIKFDYSIIHMPHPEFIRTVNYEDSSNMNMSVEFTNRRIIKWNLEEIGPQYIEATILK